MAQKIIIAFGFSIVLSFTGCNRPNYYLCHCKYEDEETNEIMTKTDTLKNLTKEEAEIECSNYATTDDPNERITCELKED